MAVEMKFTKEEKERAKEVFRDYLPTPGCGAILFDYWNEIAPDWLDRCTVPAKRGRRAAGDRRRNSDGAGPFARAHALS